MSERVQSIIGSLAATVCCVATVVFVAALIGWARTNATYDVVLIVTSVIVVAVSGVAGLIVGSYVPKDRR